MTIYTDNYIDHIASELFVVRQQRLGYHIPVSSSDKARKVNMRIIRDVLEAKERVDERVTR